MQYVLVNGVPVIDGGKQTDALPGKVLRGPGYRKVSGFAAGQRPTTKATKATNDRPHATIAAPDDLLPHIRGPGGRCPPNTPEARQYNRIQRWLEIGGLLLGLALLAVLRGYRLDARPALLGLSRRARTYSLALFLYVAMLLVSAKCSAAARCLRLSRGAPLPSL